jgi:predicted naringenin-chalcone synthase
MTKSRQYICSLVCTYMHNKIEKLLHSHDQKVETTYVPRYAHMYMHNKIEKLLHSHDQKVETMSRYA